MEYPFLHLQSPLTYRSLSLNTRMDVLYTLTARSVPSSVTAWYTLASLPVDMHPLICAKTPWDSILKRMSLVRGSSACSTVALSALSLTMFPDLPTLRSFSRNELPTRWPTLPPPPYASSLIFFSKCAMLCWMACAPLACMLACDPLGPLPLLGPLPATWFLPWLPAPPLALGLCPVVARPPPPTCAPLAARFSRMSRDSSAFMMSSSSSS